MRKPASGIGEDAEIDFRQSADLIRFDPAARQHRIFIQQAEIVQCADIRQILRDPQQAFVVFRIPGLCLRIAEIRKARFRQDRLLVAVAVFLHDFVGGIVVALPELIRFADIQEQIRVRDIFVGKYIGMPGQDVEVVVRIVGPELSRS